MSTDNMYNLCNHAQLAVASSAAPDGAGHWDVWVTDDGMRGDYACTVTTEELRAAAAAGTEIYDRHTGDSWEG